MCYIRYVLFLIIGWDIRGTKDTKQFKSVFTFSTTVSAFSLQLLIALGFLFSRESLSGMCRVKGTKHVNEKTRSSP